MIVEQFHREFDITLDKVASEAYPEFLPAEKDYYLNEAQDRFIKTRYGKNNIYGVGFEEIQKRTDDLKNLVKSRFCTVSTVSHYSESGENIFRADINSLYSDEALITVSSDEYMLYLKSSAKTCIGTCCKYFKVKLVQQDDLASVANDPFNKPRADRPIIFFEDGNIFIWVDQGTTVQSMLVTFIKRPVQINIGTYGLPKVECELSEYTHREIVQMAVQIALENISSPRTQTQEAINVKRVE